MDALFSINEYFELKTCYPGINTLYILMRTYLINMTNNFFKKKEQQQQQLLFTKGKQKVFFRLTKEKQMHYIFRYRCGRKSY